MSQGNNGKSHKLDLKLNLSLWTRGDTSRRMGSADDGESSPSSCVSSENEQSPEASSLVLTDSPEDNQVLAACPDCLMYVILSSENLRCPKCKNAVLLNFLSTSTSTGTGNGTVTRTPADAAATNNKMIRKG